MTEKKQTLTFWARTDGHTHTHVRRPGTIKQEIAELCFTQLCDTWIVWITVQCTVLKGEVQSRITIISRERVKISLQIGAKDWSRNVFWKNVKFQNVTTSLFLIRFFIIFAPICREIFMLSFQIMVILDWTSPLIALI